MADVLLLAVDSWGGVASMITLAGALRDLGVSTRIAAYSDFGDKVRAAGCDFVDLEVSLADWWESQSEREASGNAKGGGRTCDGRGHLYRFRAWLDG